MSQRRWLAIICLKWKWFAGLECVHAIVVMLYFSVLIKVICCQFLTKVHILKFRCNTLFYGILSGLFRNSGEGDFHILHYVQYGLDGVDKYHLRADHAYRSVVNSSVFIVISTELKLTNDNDAV